MLREASQGVLPVDRVRRHDPLFASAPASWLQDAVSEDELLTENVAKRLRMDHKYRPRFKAWTADEAKQFLRSAPRTHRWYALYAMALMLGLRRGELLGPRWSDVDFDRATVRVRHALHRVNGALGARPGQDGRLGSRPAAAAPTREDYLRAPAVQATIARPPADHDRTAVTCL